MILDDVAPIVVSGLMGLAAVAASWAAVGSGGAVWRKLIASRHLRLKLKGQEQLAELVALRNRLAHAVEADADLLLTAERKIEALLQELHLAESDSHPLLEGLHQPSARGRARYIKKILNMLPPTGPRSAVDA